MAQVEIGGFKTGDTVYLNQRGFSGWPMRILEFHTSRGIEQAICEGVSPYTFSQFTGIYSSEYKRYINVYALTQLTHQKNAALYPNRENDNG